MTAVIEGAVTVRRAHPGDLEELERMVARCSAESIQDRMHGGTRRGDLAGSLRATLRDGPGAVLVATAGPAVVGCLQLLRDTPDAPSAELALLVEDAHQGRGIGTRLMAAVPAWAADAGVPAVTFSVQAANGRARRLVRHLAPGRVAWQWQQAVLEAVWHLGAP
ncbi:GNAT family N-acetyltransferase [Streptomyces sp. NPDC004065]|uniref:GNAT family N-acetyltransferase n=1 Tax=Streptomyces sp. NPDC004065 TaxID=3364689 RepID=UPI00384D4AE9